MTLATMRSYVWKMSGDVMIHYRRKKIPPPTTMMTTEEGKDDDDEEEEETEMVEEHIEEEEWKHLQANPSPVESKRSSTTVETVESNGKNPVGGNTYRVQNLIY
jgi:hypothetical protein